MLNQHHIGKIFDILSDNHPEPKTELEYTNNFTLSVAVILSAQATDISVNKATKSLFETYDTPEKLLLLGEVKLKNYIKSIGLFNSKAKNIIALCHILVERFNSAIPDKFDELIKLPGIGRKTANVILNCAFGQHTIAVDTHVMRVSQRLGLSDSSTPEKIEKDLLKIIPAKELQYAHHRLILHGRYICKARKPLCDRCDIAKYCFYYNNIKK